MTDNITDRTIALPPPALNRRAGQGFPGGWWWNAPRAALSSPLEQPLTRDFCRRQQMALSQQATLPRCLRTLLYQRYTFLLETKGVALRFIS